MTFLLEEEEFETCDPTIGSSPLTFVFHITLLDFFWIKKQTYKGGGTFHLLQVPCGDPKVFLFFNISFGGGVMSPFPYMHQKSVIYIPTTIFLTLDLCACLCFHFTFLSLRFVFFWGSMHDIRGVKVWMKKRYPSWHDRMFMWVKI
jgi:hypothetical protein